MELGIVPDLLKKARVTPVFKQKGSRDDLSDCRPISVVSYTAKILEKGVSSQLCKFLERNKLLTTNQSAFRTAHSTSTSLHNVVDQWLENMNNGQFSGILFLDIRKCSDSISHEILHNKLKDFGIYHKEHDWFTSYLTGRQQATLCGEDMSSFAAVKSGIPQGSALGPTLSLIFLNDLPLCQTNLHLNLYDDDTAGSCSGKSVEDVIRKLQNGLNDISVWFSNNYLGINAEKSNFMIISSQSKVGNLNIQTSTLNLDGKVLHQIDNISHLGIHINEKLCWKPHVNQLFKKLGKKDRGT